MNGLDEAAKEHADPVPIEPKEEPPSLSTPEKTVEAGVPVGVSPLIAKEGDHVILWGSYSDSWSFVLEHGKIFNCRYGSFMHSDMIDEPFGTKVLARKGGRWVAMLRPTPELVTQTVVHRTQIIYHADISLLLMLLDARPGKVLCEAGTGSGSVSRSVARALRPGGLLHTFEFHADRQRQAQEDFVTYGITDVVTSYCRDVCTVGFPENLRNSVDGVFLDLPAPWTAVPHVNDCLVAGGKVCTFSPGIEQIDRTATELRRRGFLDVRMFESIAMTWAVKEQGHKKSMEPPAKRRRGAYVDGDHEIEKAPEWVSFQLPVHSHTGYLLIATKPPENEPQD